MDPLKQFEQTAKNLKTSSEAMLEGWLNNPLIKDALGAEHKDLVREAKNKAFSLQGTDPAAKVIELNKLLDNVVSINK